MVSWPPGEEVGGEQGDVVDLGHGAVGEGGRGHLRQDVVAGLAATVLDVGGELLVEELERLVRPAPCVTSPNPSANAGVVLLGDAFELGDDQERERLGVVVDDVAPPGRRSARSSRRPERPAMNSSFSRSRPGVRSRIIRARWAVWSGGSNDGSWSLNGSISR